MSSDELLRVRTCGELVVALKHLVSDDVLFASGVEDLSLALAGEPLDVESLPGEFIALSSALENGFIDS